MNTRNRPFNVSAPLSALFLTVLISLPVSAQNLGGALSIINIFSAGDAGSPLSQLTDTGFLPRGITTLPALASAGQLLLSNNDGPAGIVLGLGGPLKGQLFPAFDVLVTNPTSLFDYFIDGGTVLSPELVIVPGIPLLSSPIGL